MSSSATQPPSPPSWAEQAEARIQALGLKLSTAQYQSIGKGLSRLYIPDAGESSEPQDFIQTLQAVRHV